MPRAGLTLVEVVVVLVVLSIGTALVLPSLVFPESREVMLADVIRSARANAVARGQALALRVEPSGVWSLSIHGLRGAPLSRGQLSGRDARGVEMRFSPLGGCMLASSPPATLTDWDAARCAPLARRERAP